MKTAFELASVALVELVRRQLAPAQNSHQASDSELNRPLVTGEDPEVGVGNSSKDAANKKKDGEEVLAHGGSSGGLSFGDEKFGEMLASQSGEHTISDAIGQHVGPLSHSRGGDSDSFGGGCDRAPKQFDGASFKHDGAKVSTLTATPQVRLPLAGF